MLLDALRQKTFCSHAQSSIESGMIKLKIAGQPRLPVIGVNIEASRARGGRGSGITPLYFACQSGRPETVRLLLEAGADVQMVILMQACLNFKAEDGLWLQHDASEIGTVLGRTIALRLSDLLALSSIPK
jgi:hypothetical protein